LKLIIISEYHIFSSFPANHRTLPAKDEVCSVLQFAEDLLERICGILDIDIEEIKADYKKCGSMP